jgi:hypothetical protein
MIIYGTVYFADAVCRNIEGVHVGIESIHTGVETYTGDEGGVTKAFAWMLTAYAQVSRVYAVLKACTRAVGEQEDTHVGVRNSKDKKKGIYIPIGLLGTCKGMGVDASVNRKVPSNSHLRGVANDSEDVTRPKLISTLSGGRGML